MRVHKWLYSTTIFVIVSAMLRLLFSVALLVACSPYVACTCTDPDCFASVPQLISDKGYPVESHDVSTSDGYVLTMHRIPRPGAPAVLLQHGLLDASETWVINSASNSLGFILHDSGFDVFMVRPLSIKRPCIMCGYCITRPPLLLARSNGISRATIAATRTASATRRSRTPARPSGIFHSPKWRLLTCQPMYRLH
jgi:hypothetical protein